MSNTPNPADTPNATDPSIIPIPGGVSDFLEGLTQSEGVASSYASTPIELLTGMLIAAFLGALIAYHPNRTNGATNTAAERDVKKTQILICVAGAVLIPLVEGSLARAFALAGIGSFVRYRTVLSSPMDLSIIFILIGLGMACGIKYYSFAFSITGFIYLLLFVIDLGGNYSTWSLRIDCNAPQSVRETFQDIAAQRGIRILRQKTNSTQGSYRCRFVAKNPIDTDRKSVV